MAENKEACILLVGIGRIKPWAAHGWNFPSIGPNFRSISQ
jgi:hypothetical protein